MKKYFPKLNKQNSALLIIDVINSCAHPKYERKEWGIEFKRIRKMIIELNRFIADFRNTGIPIVFIKTVPWQKKYLPDNINELYKNRDVCFYTLGKPGFGEFFYGVEPLTKDYVFEKNTYDAFASADFLSFASKRKIKYFIVAGLFADACVLFSVSGGFAKGYNFVVLSDLVESYDRKQGLKKVVLNKIIPSLFGQVMSSSELLKQIK